MKFLVATAFTDVTHLCDLAVAADRNGWDGVVVSDHVVHPEKLSTPYPYTPDGSRRWEASAPWPDPWVAIGAMAAVTTRIRFLTSVYVLAMRDPFTVAKAVGTAAVLSNHRVTLGIGVGWMKDEYELLGQDFHTRGRRTDEMIDVLRTLWRGAMVAHHGRHYDFDRLQMSPAVEQPIPIYSGGISDAALRRVGRLSDGWISDLHTTAELESLLRRVRAYREEYGRGHVALPVVASVTDAFDLDGYRRLAEMGVTHLQTMPWVLYGGSAGSLTDKLDALARFADEVIAVME